MLGIKLAVTVVGEKLEEGENMVAGQDINFDMIHVLGKEKDSRPTAQGGNEEGKEDKKRGDKKPGESPGSMSAGASRSQFQLQKSH